MEKLKLAKVPYEKRVASLFQSAGLPAPDQLVSREFSFFLLNAPEEEDPAERDPAIYIGRIEGYTVSADENGNERIALEISTTQDVNGGSIWDLSWVDATGWVLRSEDYDDLTGILDIRPKGAEVATSVAAPMPAKSVVIEVPTGELAIGTVLRIEMIPEGAVAQLVNSSYGETKFFRRAGTEILETEFNGNEWRDKSYTSQKPHPKQLCWLVELP